MFFGLRSTLNVENFMTVCLQVICDEAAMASPPNRLGTHDRHALVAGEFNQAFDSFNESLALHIIGVAPERFVSPCGIAGIGSRSSPATELEQMVIVNPSFRERIGQWFFVELRITP